MSDITSLDIFKGGITKEEISRLENEVEEVADNVKKKIQKIKSENELLDLLDDASKELVERLRNNGKINIIEEDKNA